MKRLRRFTPLLLTFSLTAAALTPWAAAGGPRLVTASQAASSQTVGFDRLPADCQSLQATFALSAGGDYDFLANQTLTALPGVYATFRQSGAAVTVYVTAKTGSLTQDGSLTLGAISSQDGSAFTVSKATGLKVVGADSTQTTYATVDTAGSTGGSVSGGSDSSAGDSGPSGGEDGSQDSGGDSSGGSNGGGDSDSGSPDSSQDGSSGSSDSASGGSGQTARAITIPAAAGGQVTASAAKVVPGKVVTLTALPDSGYTLQSLAVTRASGQETALTSLGGGRYTFVMPASAVTVTASFAPQGAQPALPFRDVAQGTWYYSGVEYAYAHGLMSGTGEGAFSPHLDTSRGMLVTILYRLAGSPAVGAEAAFSDVSQGDWYADGVAWASANGVVSGYPGGLFGPNDPITREQMVAILYQFARLQGQLDSGRADLSRYTDADTLSAYAQEPMGWAVAQGFISGLSADTLGPLASTTRAQAAVILTAFAKAVG